MSVRVVVGAQWGDEGKGKIVDYLSEEADVVVRYQGGANAGHTVLVGDQEFILHLLPCGILRPGKVCVIGNGLVIDPAALMDEITMLRSKGIDVTGRLFISQNAHLIMPYHKLLDRMSEEGLEAGERIGTTGRGIGPAYVDKVARRGIRIVDLLDREVLCAKLTRNIREVNKVLEAVYHKETLDADRIIAEYLEFDKQIDAFVTDTSVLVNDAIDAGKHVLFEGGQGTLLDVDHGTYPYLTSSNTTSGGACTGVGVGPTRIDEVIGVVKAYTSRVGNGPFPTEFPAKWGDEFRRAANEFGATTGRPRRCGWFDAMIVKYAVRVNGISTLAITRLDTLDELAHLRICVGYRDGNKALKHLPSDANLLARCEPIYEDMEGWGQPTRHARTWDDLPQRAREYLSRIAELAGADIAIVSVGSRRDETIFV
ncbi:MAG: adenylosuccinate synthase [Candidatus Latescibacteria bacterium]|nr:adenylosuccinate synthase [Candidatus Latescibacterota bacterium]